ncbi:MAG: AEC family transporter [Clostridia bacterium]|nr:AEC family transporter [Clostridia bacterium]
MDTNITSAVSSQVIIMAIFIAVGYLFTKIKMFSHDGTREMTNLLLYIVTPCVIIKSFQQGYNPDSLKKLGVAFIVAIAVHVVMFVSSKFIYIKSKDKNRSIVDRFCISYSNCGFMGIPLLEAALGAEGVFVGSAYLAVFNVFVWTQGYKMFTAGTEKTSILKVILNPGVIGVTLSAILVFSGIKLPKVATTAIEGMSALNTPVAMVLLGIYLAETKILDALKNVNLYIVCILRLLVMPIAVVIALKALNIDISVSYATILSAACPCATISAIFAARFNKNSGYASSVVAVSTLFSLASLPFIAYITSAVFA